MSIAYPWYWQIQAMNQGPDYEFWAAVLPSEASQLADFIAHYLPPNFFQNPAARPLPGYARYTQYVDQHTYDKLQAQAQGEDNPVWLAALIEVCDHTLSIRNLLGGSDYGETPLLIHLAKSQEVTLQQWRVSYSGDGYKGGNVAQGNDARSLLAYLHYQDRASQA